MRNPVIKHAILAFLTIFIPYQFLKNPHPAGNPQMSKSNPD